MLFSTSKQAFYSEDLEYSDLPADVIKIDEETWLNYLSKINSGYYIYSYDSNIKTSLDKKPGIYYSFNVSTEEWEQSADQKEKQELLNNKSKINKATSLYTDTSNKLIEYGYMIDDKDYSVYTEDKLQDIKSQLTAYRISLRSYINTDGSGEVPYYETT